MSRTTAPARVYRGTGRSTKTAFPPIRRWLGKNSSNFRARRIWLAIGLRNNGLKPPDHQPGEASAGGVCKREISISKPQGRVPPGLLDDRSEERRVGKEGATQ